MATFEEYRKQLDNTIKQLKRDRGKETFLLASDAVNRIRDRVIETGEKATGGKFKPYSPAYAVKKGKTRQVTFRDFKFTNQMWKDISALTDKKGRDTQSYIITARLPANRELILRNIENANGENFLELSQREIELLDELNQERLVNTLKNNGIS